MGTGATTATRPVDDRLPLRPRWPTDMSANGLDDAIYAASKELRGRGAPEPDVLFLMATGVDLLGTSYEVTWRLPLESVAGAPRCWRGLTLLAAETRTTCFWFLEDAPGDPQTGNAPAQDELPWARGFPCWLAACSGATVCVHTSAGYALPADDGVVRAGGLALVRDHINLSGGTPLFGLGESRLGPIFPDQTRVHHEGLRLLALRHGERLGIPLSEGVAACTAGPSIATRAERAFYARAGAHIAVQGLAAPLLAAAHAGLSCLALVAVIDADGETALESQLAAADSLAPALQDLLFALGPELGALARELREDPL